MNTFSIKSWLQARSVWRRLAILASLTVGIFFVIPAHITFASSGSCAGKTGSAFTKCVNKQKWCQNGNTEVNGKCSSGGGASSCPSGYSYNKQTNSCTQSGACPGGQYKFGGCSGSCAIVDTTNAPACVTTQSTSCSGQWASNCKPSSSPSPTTQPTTSPSTQPSSSPTTQPTTPHSSNPAPYTPPACTAPGGGSSSSSGPFIANGCAGSCSSAGCTPTHEETGTITTTTHHWWYTCPGPTEHSSTSQSVANVTESSANNCQQITKAVACVKDRAGYAWEENCLVYNGQDTHCSAPFQQYNPISCPVPVPANN